MKYEIYDQNNQEKGYPCRWIDANKFEIILVKNCREK